MALDLGILLIALCLGLGSSRLGLDVSLLGAATATTQILSNIILRMSADWDDLFLLHHNCNSWFFSFPSKGYVYLVFESEKSVRALLQACSQDLLSPDGLSEYYFKMSSRRMRCKEVRRAVRAA